MSVRPGFRANYFNSTHFNRDPRAFRYGSVANSINLRRPFNPNFAGPNQFVNISNGMPNFQHPQMHMGNYVNVLHPLSYPIQPNQQPNNPYLYAQTQQNFYPFNAYNMNQQPVNWMQMVQQPVATLSQNSVQQFWQPNQINRFPNGHSPAHLNNGNMPGPVQNNWDPAMSTNVSSLISQSILTSSTGNNNQDKNPNNFTTH